MERKSQSTAAVQYNNENGSIQHHHQRHDDDDNDGGPPTPKRMRLNEDDGSGHHPVNGIKDANDDYNDIPSMEFLLSVPAEIIFESVGGSNNNINNRRTLLTTAEAECFLKVSCIAQEMDVLFDAGQVALEQQQYCRSYKQRIQQQEYNKNPFIHSIIPIVYFLEKQVKPELQHFQQRYTILLMELSSCISTLRQSSEQNWTLADSLISAFDSSTTSVGVITNNDDNNSGQRSLVQEKQMLAELEEELLNRIECIMEIMSQTNHQPIISNKKETATTTTTRRNLFPADGHPGPTTSKTATYIFRRNTESMSDLAFRLFGIKKQPDPSDNDDDKMMVVEGEEDRKNNRVEQRQMKAPSSATAAANYEQQQGGGGEAEISQKEYTQPNSEDARTILRNLHNHHHHHESSQNSLCSNKSTSRGNAAEALASLAATVGTQRSM